MRETLLAGGGIAPNAAPLPGPALGGVDGAEGRAIRADGEAVDDRLGQRRRRRQPGQRVGVAEVGAEESVPGGVAARVMVLAEPPEPVRRLGDEQLVVGELVLGSPSGALEGGARLVE